MKEEEEGEAQETPEGVRVGLCASCARAKVLETKIGAAIYLCTLSSKDSRYRRFPQLPVMACPGYEKAPVE